MGLLLFNRHQRRKRADKQDKKELEAELAKLRKANEPDPFMRTGPRRAPASDAGPPRVGVGTSLLTEESTDPFGLGTKRRRV